MAKAKKASKANIGVPEKDKQQVANLLNVLLADESVLYAKTRNFHWNVTGPNFYGLHKLLDEQYNELQDITDEIAERVRQIGHFAVGSLSDFLKLTNLVEAKDGNLSAENMLKELVSDHEIIIHQLRNEIKKDENLKDDVTADFVTGLAEKHEKMVWMLRSSI